MAHSGSNGSSKKGYSHSPVNGSHVSPVHPHEVAPPYQWHDKNEVIIHELEEARARATQMEKTMRWWSDCTANWREKWSKVRVERNKAREEVRILRCRLENLQRETGSLKKEKNDLQVQLSLIARDHSIQSILLPHLSQVFPEDTALQFNSDEREYPERDENVSSSKFKSSMHETVSHLMDEMFGGGNVAAYSHSTSEVAKFGNRSESGQDSKASPTDDYSKVLIKENDKCHRENDVDEKLKYQNGVLAGSGSGNSSSQPSPSHRISAISDPLPEGCHASPRASAVSDPLSEPCGTSECSETGYAESIRSSSEGVGGGRRWRVTGSGGGAPDESGITTEQDSLEQQVMMLKLRLEEATKNTQAERDEKNILDKEGSRWKAEVGELKSRLEDVRASRQEAVRELVALRAVHEKEVQSLQLEMLDEASTRECIDRRLSDLRSELERLQEENAAEWGRRERLESEKLGLERENKKVRAQITDMEERLDKRNKLITSATDSDVTSLKEEISEKNKELIELKHSHAKLKKVLANKSVELQHCNRRGDQYEAEVKRLRGRVDELKKELAAAEDEVDGASNNIRKLQRSNDELQETVENLEVQVEHLQSRLRSSQPSAVPLMTALLQDSDEEPSQY